MSVYPKAVADGWHVVATEREIGARPLARRLMDTPIVLFRGESGPTALIDRCPHRNMALSSGRVVKTEIECPYHGWRFDGAGRCVATPGFEKPAPHRAEALPIRVRAGLVFTTLAPAPIAEPRLPTPLDNSDVDSFLWPVRPSRARLVDAVENLLDAAHPHFLHAGIVRSRTRRREVQTTVSVYPTHAEAVYVENARPAALMPRVLEGLRGKSYGRFFPPATGQIAFEGEHGLRLAITVFFTPESQTQVRPFAHFATPKRVLPAMIKEWLLRAFHIPVLAQDQAALRRQAEDIDRFGAPRYALGPLDLLFPSIQALLDGAAPEPSERRVTLWL